MADLRSLIDLASITKFVYLLTVQSQLRNLIAQHQSPNVCLDSELYLFYGYLQYFRPPLYFFYMSV